MEIFLSEKEAVLYSLSKEQRTFPRILKERNAAGTWASATCLLNKEKIEMKAHCVYIFTCALERKRECYNFEAVNLCFLKNQPHACGMADGDC